MKRDAPGQVGHLYHPAGTRSLQLLRWSRPPWITDISPPRSLSLLGPPRVTQMKRDVPSQVGAPRSPSPHLPNSIAEIVSATLDHPADISSHRSLRWPVWPPQITQMTPDDPSQGRDLDHPTDTSSPPALRWTRPR